MPPTAFKGAPKCHIASLLLLLDPVSLLRSRKQQAANSVRVLGRSQRGKNEKSKKGRMAGSLSHCVCSTRLAGAVWLGVVYRITYIHAPFGYYL